jgi:hypothetical protein
MADEADAARLRLLYDLGCAFTARIELNDLLPFIIEKCRDALAAEGVPYCCWIVHTTSSIFPMLQIPIRKLLDVCPDIGSLLRLVSLGWPSLQVNHSK